jgi:3-oxoacyl-[acyl-carrier protein] reductase
VSAVALVTGASRGIGRAIAIALGSDGHAVAVNFASRADAAEEVVSEIRAGGGKAEAFQADVSDPDQVEDLFARVGAALGPVAILVNNAGITADNLVLRMSPEEFDRVIDTNLRSAFLCTKAALKGMIRARWGRVISISSVSGIAGNPGQANYAASKAGLIGLAKSVAKEVGSRGITVNVVAPGFVTTDMTGSLSEEVKAGLLSSVSLGRFGEPVEIASTVAFIASEKASYLTGQVIVVGGGIAL